MHNVLRFGGCGRWSEQHILKTDFYARYLSRTGSAPWARPGWDGGARWVFPPGTGIRSPSPRPLALDAMAFPIPPSLPSAACATPHRHRLGAVRQVVAESAAIRVSLSYLHGALWNFRPDDYVLNRDLLTRSRSGCYEPGSKSISGSLPWNSSLFHFAPLKISDDHSFVENSIMLVMPPGANVGVAAIRGPVQVSSPHHPRRNCHRSYAEDAATRSERLSGGFLIDGCSPILPSAGRRSRQN